MTGVISRLQKLRADPEAFQDFEGAFSKALDKAEAEQEARLAKQNETPEQKAERARGVLLARLNALPVDRKKYSRERAGILKELKALTPEKNSWTGEVHKPLLDFE